MPLSEGARLILYCSICISCHAWLSSPAFVQSAQGIHGNKALLQRGRPSSSCLQVRPQWRYGIELDEEAAEVAAVAAAKQESEDDTSDLESAEFTVEEGEQGDRIDKFLHGRLPQQSRTYYGSLCAEGCVIVDGSKVKKAHKVAVGQSIEVRFAPTPELNLTPQDIPLHILYEDAEIIAIAKPPGMVVHPAPGNWDGTFVNALLHHLQQSGNTVELTASGAGDSARPGVVHRLDKGTSGVLLAAKNPSMQAKLSQLFQDRAISKTYLAVCAGNPGKGAVIDVPIGRHATNRQKMVAVPETELQPSVRTRRAVSFADTAAFDGRLSVVQVRIETGRTHQIRVHMQHRRTPVVGDDLYGNREWNRRLQTRYGIARPLLHAHSLEFKHPTTGARLRIEAPLPQDTEEIVRQIYPDVEKEHPRWVAAAGHVTTTTAAAAAAAASSESGAISESTLSELGQKPVAVAGVKDGQEWYD